MPTTPPHASSTTVIAMRSVRSRILGILAGRLGVNLGVGRRAAVAARVESHPAMLKRCDNFGIEIACHQVLSRDGKMLTVGGPDLHHAAVVVRPIAGEAVS